MAARQDLEDDKAQTHVHWVPTAYMLADLFTKKMAVPKVFKEVMKHPRKILNQGIGIYNFCNCRQKKKFHKLRGSMSMASPSSSSTDEGTIPERRK